jgi:hypothetical protein
MSNRPEPGLDDVRAETPRGLPGGVETPARIAATTA